MNNMLEESKKFLRSYSKHNKNVTFSLASAISFLITGNIVSADNIVDTKKSIDDTVDKVNDNINVLRKNKEKLLNRRTLELIQLEEQGDQVVKSPWESWQFSFDYTYSGSLDVKKGYGDKSENIIFKRPGAHLLDRYKKNRDQVGSYGVTKLDLVSTYEEDSEIYVSAAIKTKIINKELPIIVLPSISKPVFSGVNVTFNSPSVPTLPTITPPQLNLSIIAPNANPFVDFGSGWLNSPSDQWKAFRPNPGPLVPSSKSIGDNILVTKGTFWSGVDLTFDGSGNVTNTTIGQSKAGSYNIDFTGYGTFAGATNSTKLYPERHRSILNMYNGRWNRSGASGVASPSTIANQSVSNAIFYANGNDGSYTDTVVTNKGTTIFYSSADLTLNNITANLYRKSSFITIEGFRAPSTTMNNVNINILGDNNTVFNIIGLNAATPAPDRYGFRGE